MNNGDDFVRLFRKLTKEIGLIKSGVYSEIVSLSNGEGYSYASYQYIGDNLKIHPETVRRHIQELIKLKLIKDNTPNRRNKPHEFVPLPIPTEFSTTESSTKKSGCQTNSKLVSDQQKVDVRPVKSGLNKEDNREVNKEKNKELIKYLSLKNVNKSIRNEIAEKVSSLKKAKKYFEHMKVDHAITAIRAGEEPKIPDSVEDRERYLKDKFSDLIKC